MIKKNYLIVGQGIAGTMLAFELLRRGQSVQIIDAGHRGAASRVAAGMINPVTGRRFAKSWMIDELIPVAEEVYGELEKKLDAKLIFPHQVHRAIHNIGDQNKWNVRSAYPEFGDYMDSRPVTEIPSGVAPPFALGAIRKAFQVRLPELITKARTYFEQLGIYREETIDYEEIKVDQEMVQINEFSADRVIFCEGYQIINNPYFNQVPMELAKGELLIIRAPQLALKQLYKNKLIIIPLGDHTFWVGATYEWEFADDHPTEAGKALLLERLKGDITVPFEVLEHRAAIRPTVKDRRPFMGFRPQNLRVGVFNGMGTKGAVLAPYWARHFAEVLVEKKKLEAEVDVQRFFT